MAGMSADTYRSRNANYRPRAAGAPGGDRAAGVAGAHRASAGNIRQHSDTSHAARTRHGTRHMAYGTRPWRAISAAIPPAPHPPRLPPACTNTKRVPWRGSTTTYPYVLPRGAAAEPWSMSKAVTTRQGRVPYAVCRVPWRVRAACDVSLCCCMLPADRRGARRHPPPRPIAPGALGRSNSRWTDRYDTYADIPAKMCNDR